MQTREEIKNRFQTEEEKLAWQLFIEQPLGVAIEEFFQSDLVRGLVFTDGTIGTLTQRIYVSALDALSNAIWA